MEGARPSCSPLRPLYLYTYAYGRIRNRQQTYVTRTVHYAHFKMNRVLKVIQGHPFHPYSPHPVRCVVVMSRAINADVISETYEDMATGKQQIRPFQRPHSSLKTSQQATPPNIYKCFILPETTVIGYIFPAHSIGLH